MARQQPNNPNGPGDDITKALDAWAAAIKATRIQPGQTEGFAAALESYNSTAKAAKEAGKAVSDFAVIMSQAVQRGLTDGRANNILAAFKSDDPEARNQPQTQPREDKSGQALGGLMGQLSKARQNIQNNDIGKTITEQFNKSRFQQIYETFGKIKKAIDDFATTGANTVRQFFTRFTTGFDVVVASLNQTVTRFAQLANPGEVELLNLALRDFQAVVGYALRPIVQQATRLIRGFADSLLNNQNILGPLIRILATAAVGLTALSVAVGLVSAALAVLGSTSTAIIAGVALLGGILSEMVGGWSNLLDAISPVTEIITGLARLIGGILGGVLRLLMVILSPLISLFQFFVRILGLVASGVRMLINLLIDLVNELTGDNIRKIGESRSGGLSSVGAAVTQASSTSADQIGLQNRISAFGMGRNPVVDATHEVRDEVANSGAKTHAGLMELKNEMTRMRQAQQRTEQALINPMR